MWSEFQPLADEGGDTADLRATLDRSHFEYDELYREAEAIAQPSVTAVKPRKRPPPPTLRVRVARRIPVGARKRIRRLVGRRG